MELLDDLHHKVDQLLKKYAQLEQENARLKAEAVEQEALVGRLNSRIAGLERNMVSVHLGKTVDDAEEKENMRAQLDSVISEIDKILNTLND